MKLVIAEKPMLARDIARAICGTPVPESAPLPISGNGYTVIACSGHLLELVEPEAVNPAWADRYDLDLLPISIPDWPKEPAVVRDKETGEVIDSKEPLIDKIAVLLPQADCVIHAGDPDDEGQLIVDEVLDYLGYEGEVLRVYVNDNIAKNIVRAFDNLVPNEGCRRQRPLHGRQVLRRERVAPRVHAPPRRVLRRSRADADPRAGGRAR